MAPYFQNKVLISTMGKFLINIYFNGNKLILWLKRFGFLKTINHFLKQEIPLVFKAVFSFSMNLK